MAANDFWQMIAGRGGQMPNRAQRRAADKEWARLARQQKKARARARTIPQTGQED